MPQSTQLPGPCPEQYPRPAHAGCVDNTTQSTDEQVMEGDRNLVHVVVLTGRTASKQPSGYIQPTADVSGEYLSHYLLLLTKKHNGAPLAEYPVTSPHRI